MFKEHISFRGSSSQPLTHLQDYKKLGNSGLRVSPLCLGTMTFGTQWIDIMGKCEKDEAQAMFNKYIELGGNFIDTANKYQEGEAEEWIGEFVKNRGNRDGLVIATKYSLPQPLGNVNYCGNHRKSMFFSIEKSLERLKTNYIDLYYVHFWDHSTPEIEIMRGLDDLVRSGKVLYVGISDTPAWEVARCNTLTERYGWTPFIAYQGRHNIGDRSMEREIVPMCRKMGLGVIPWSILGGSKYTEKIGRTGGGETPRNMTEKDIAINLELNRISSEIGRPANQVIVNWEMQQPGIVSAVLGLRRMSHLDDNIRALEFKLSTNQIERLNSIASFDLGFPLDFIGTSYETSQWVNWRSPDQ